MKKQLLILFTLLIAAISYAQTVGDTFVDNFITYEVTSISPNEVKTISYDATNGGTDVDIPASVIDNAVTYSVTTIGFGTFEEKGLTSVTIPNSIITIEEEAFFDNQLTSISIPNSVTNIGASAFQINLITSVTIPSSMTSIEGGVFKDNLLIDVFFTNNIVTIGSGAFQNNMLTTIALPSSLTTIGFRAFENNNLTSVFIPNTVTLIDHRAFAVNQLTSVIISNNVISIGIASFTDNQLTSVIIPDSVTSIGIAAFQNNPLLTDVISESTIPPTITTGGSEDTFGATQRGNINLTIPNGTENAYIAAQWINFASVTLGVSDFELANDVSIFNTTDELKIVSNGLARLEHYTIYSISGAKIKEGKESTIAIDVLSSGIYIIELNFNNGRLAKKFAK